MTRNNPNIPQIMNEAVELTLKTFGDLLKQVWLFGSYARGDADEDSDIDFMVVLSEPVDTWKVADDVFADFSMDILDRYDEIPSVFITDVDRFGSQHNPLYKTVREEGVLYYGV